MKWIEHVGATALRRLLATLANARRMRQRHAQQRAQQRQANAQRRGRDDDDEDDNQEGDAAGEDGADYGLQQTSRAQLESLLRLMRAACVSPVLLNGGDGCTSEVAELNEMARREGMANPVVRQMQQVVRNTWDGGMGGAPTQLAAGGVGMPGAPMYAGMDEDDDCCAGLMQMTGEAALHTLVNESRQSGGSGSASSDMVTHGQQPRRKNYDTGRKTAVDSVAERLVEVQDKEKNLLKNVDKVRNVQLIWSHHAKISNQQH
jgi:hypothetical protein